MDVLPLSHAQHWKLLFCQKTLKDIIENHKLNEKCSILISPVHKKIKEEKLVKWILKDNLNVRFQIQLHKQIWDEDTKGV